MSDIIKKVEDTVQMTLQSIVVPGLGDIKEAVKINLVKIDNLDKSLNKHIDDLQKSLNKRIDDTNNEVRDGFRNLQFQINQIRNDLSVLNERTYNSLQNHILKMEDNFFTEFRNISRDPQTGTAAAAGEVVKKRSRKNLRKIKKQANYSQPNVAGGLLLIS